MQFAFTDEQQEFRNVLRRFLQNKSPPTEVRRLMDTEAGWNREEWRKLNQDLGLTGVRVPEAYGGQGFGMVELGIVMEEMGRALLCAPFFSSAVLAATAIDEAGTEEQKRQLLPAIAAGDKIAALAFTEDNGRWDTAGIEMTANADGDGFRLDGAKSFVVDGHTADLIVAVARKPGTKGDEGLSFFTVSADAEGLTRRPLKTMDATRKLARVEFKGVTARLLGSEGAGAKPLARTLDIASVALAHEMAGGAERLREDALDYVNMRVQFGRTIGSFQVTKHKAADMLLDVELAKSAAYYAAEACDENAPDFPAVASLAKAQASDVYMQTAIHAVQMHGGIGFTWDNDTHLWFKRARSSEAFLGDPAWHRELMMQRWDTGAERASA